MSTQSNNSERDYFAVLQGGENEFKLITPYLEDKKTAQDYLAQLKPEHPDAHIGHWTFEGNNGQAMEVCHGC